MSLKIIKRSNCENIHSRYDEASALLLRDDCDSDHLFIDQDLLQSPSCFPVHINGTGFLVFEDFAHCKSVLETLSAYCNGIDSVGVGLPIRGSV